MINYKIIVLLNSKNSIVMYRKITISKLLYYKTNFQVEYNYQKYIVYSFIYILNEIITILIRVQK